MRKRRTGREALHTRVRESEARKLEHNRSRRRARDRRESRQSHERTTDV